MARSSTACGRIRSRPENRSARAPADRHEPRALLARRRRIPRQVLGSEFVEVVLPVCGIVAAKFVQVVPAEDAGRVQVIEDEADGIIADRQDLKNFDITLAGNGLTLLFRVALNLGARTLH